MPSLSRAIKYLLHDRMQFLDSTVKNLGFLFPDKLYLTLRFRLQMGKWIDWNNPKTFNEKLQWLKLYNRNTEYTTMVDKYAVKEYVAGKIGKQYIIPTLGVWEHPKDIEWEKLPEQFVLKTTDGGGGSGVVICPDKSNLDIDGVVKKLNYKSHYFSTFREWPYINVKRQIIAEKFINSRLPSAFADFAGYKFYCFNGDPLYCQVIRDCHAKELIDFYDMEWNHQKFVGLNSKYENRAAFVEMPFYLNDMILICRKLAKDIPFVRVDIYVIGDKEYFGELTFYPVERFGRFSPDEWNEKIGDLLTLPTETRERYKCLIINGVIEIHEIKGNYDDLKDYKFFCFDGCVKFFKVDYNRYSGHRANYYDKDGELLPFGEKTVCPPDFNHKEKIPENLCQMINIAEKLSHNLPFLRVDLFNVNGMIYFGEMTFFPAGGFGPFEPDEWDKKLGDMLKLPKSIN